MTETTASTAIPVTGKSEPGGSRAPETGVSATPELKIEPRYAARQIDEHLWELCLTLPGVKRDDVEISLDDNELEITAHRRHTVPQGWRALHGTRPSPTSYDLRLKLGIEIDPDRITAKLEDGNLTLRLPVAESARPRRIEVE